MQKVHVQPFKYSNSEINSNINVKTKKPNVSILFFEKSPLTTKHDARGTIRT